MSDKGRHLIAIGTPTFHIVARSWLYSCMQVPKREEVTGGCRSLHNLYTWPNIIRVIVSKVGDGRVISTHGRD
jgi:hypothetical protein